MKPTTTALEQETVLEGKLTQAKPSKPWPMNYRIKCDHEDRWFSCMSSVGPVFTDDRDKAATFPSFTAVQKVIEHPDFTLTIIEATRVSDDLARRARTEQNRVRAQCLASDANMPIRVLHKGMTMEERTKLKEALTIAYTDLLEMLLTPESQQRMCSKMQLLQWVQRLYGEARIVDATHVDDLCTKQLGEVWLWSNLTTDKLHHLAATFLRIARLP